MSKLETKTVNCKKIIKNLLSDILAQKYTDASKVIKEAEKVIAKSEDAGYTSMLLSLSALLGILRGKYKFSEALKILKDSAQLAKFSKSVYAEMFKEYVLAEIYYKNSDTSVALCHYNNVKTLGLTAKDEYSLGGYVISRIKQIRTEQKFLFPPTSDPLVSLVKIGRSITAQTDIDVLLRVIAEETKIALQAIP